MHKEEVKWPTNVLKGAQSHFQSREVQIKVRTMHLFSFITLAEI